MIILKSLRLRPLLQQTAEMEKTLPEESETPASAERNIFAETEIAPASSGGVFFTENPAVAVPETPVSAERNIFVETESAPAASGVVFLTENPAVAVPETPVSAERNIIVETESAPAASGVVFTSENMTAQEPGSPVFSETSGVSPEEPLRLSELRMEPAEIREEPRALFSSEKMSEEAPKLFSRGSEEREYRLRREQDTGLSAEDLHSMTLLEKICSTLELIAGLTEECSRKMDSEEENELKYN